MLNQAVLAVLCSPQFTAAGLAVGVAFSLRRNPKSMLPLVTGGAVGSIADIVYGLGFTCREKLGEYKRAKAGPT
jgi:hypothetical protein